MLPLVSEESDVSPIIEHLRTLAYERAEAIAAWFDSQYAASPPSFYSSVDLRHAGFKLAPVDTNLFPAGFNHLSQAANTRAVAQIQRVVAAIQRPVQRVLIIPENHTRNPGYLANLQALAHLFEEAGYEVVFGSLAAESGRALVLEAPEGAPIVQQPLQKTGNQLTTEGGFVPDLIVVNNDMTAGAPSILKGLTQQVVPQMGLGWYRRRKSIHFEAYDRVARQFAQAFAIDPWLIAAPFHQCGLINFKERRGIECVALGVEKVLRSVRAKYAEYDIKQTPYAFIKADSGTYGMGIMTARSGEEVTEMNKKIRNKMNVIKEGVASTEVIIQEGVPSIDTVHGAVAEPMMYLIGGEPVGGAYRVNAQRDPLGNLNAKGMHFHGMCDEQEPGDAAHTRVKYCNFMVFGLIARLATLAASREEYGEGYVI